MDTRLIAIDPGANGGIAALCADGRAEAWPMPQTEGEVADLMESLLNPLDGPPVCYIEKVGGFIAGHAAPGSAMFNFGRNYGFVLGVLAALRIRTVLVTPQFWQRALGLGKSAGDKAAWKRKLKAEAWRLYPQLKPTLKTADALLILECARRMEAAR